MLRAVVFAFCLFTLTTGIAAADEPVIGHSGLPVPRFVNLKADETWGRIGPSLDHPVRYEFTRRHLPVKVIAETRDNVWRQVVDMDGATMWVHQSKLTSSGHVMVNWRDGVVMQAEPVTSSRARAQLEYGVLARLEACEAAWCEVRTEGFRGWVPKAALWGVEE